MGRGCPWGALAAADRTEPPRGRSGGRSAAPPDPGGPGTAQRETRGPPRSVDGRTATGRVGRGRHRLDALHLTRASRRDVPQAVQQQLQHHANARLHRDLLRDDPRCAHHSTGRATGTSRGFSAMERRRPSPLGWRHPCGRDGSVRRPGVQPHSTWRRRSGYLQRSQQRAASDRALHPAQR